MEYELWGTDTTGLHWKDQELEDVFGCASAQPCSKSRPRGCACPLLPALIWNSYCTQVSHLDPVLHSSPPASYLRVSPESEHMPTPGLQACRNSSGADSAAEACNETSAPGAHCGSSCGNQTMPVCLSLPSTEQKIPHSLAHNVIIDSEFPGAEYCLPEVSVCSSILPSFGARYEPPASSDRGSPPRHFLSCHTFLPGEERQGMESLLSQAYCTSCLTHPK
nr:uncharacterized protein LOC110362652 [Columba livia]XP_021150242.1 uncharacterized protein LOC110362652 [Columba livia]XP_021150243.1 uncharacterized protein LOC110362652 [Columba livia]XP_021150244.1 uncharacterized protein LOC110362652 [Columba livia]XP_021150245.1 uncharacterized protein LOC110362652 [Columba livia]XP_021150246.1 uncharacterized protein LOC110362652 [Columba livia]XP_021150247.1 uncharacterized protein LOC110362652 [Columba livia]